MQSAVGRLLLALVYYPVLAVLALRSTRTCNCDCCQAEFLREESTDANNRLQCAYAQPGLQPASPYRDHEQNTCGNLCKRAAADKVLTATSGAGVVDTERFCFFECAPRLLADEDEPKQGNPCEPLVDAAIAEVRDDTGNGLPPMEQAAVALPHFLVAQGGTVAATGASAGSPAVAPAGPAVAPAEPWSSMKDPAPDRFAMITQQAVDSAKAAADAASGSGKQIEDLASRAFNSVTVASAAVEDARRAALEAHAAEQKVRTFHDVLERMMKRRAFMVLPQELPGIMGKARADAKTKAQKKALAFKKNLVASAPKAGQKAAAPYRAAMQSAADTAAQYSKAGDDLAGQAKTFYAEAQALEGQAGVQKAYGWLVMAKKLDQKAQRLARKALAMNKQASVYYKTSQAISVTNVPEYANQASQAAYHAEVMVNPDTAPALPPIM